jgi:hypothetical protein
LRLFSRSGDLLSRVNKGCLVGAEVTLASSVPSFTDFVV